MQDKKTFTMNPNAAMFRSQMYQAGGGGNMQQQQGQGQQQQGQGQGQTNAYSDDKAAGQNDFHGKPHSILQPSQSFWKDYISGYLVLWDWLPIWSSLKVKGKVHLNIVFSYMKVNKICNLDLPVY